MLYTANDKTTISIEARIDIEKSDVSNRKV